MEKIKLLMGGSPCTHWSIAQTRHRETEASGLGWELFLNYRIARDKYKPDYFLYENNKSMSAAIRAQITKELGVEPVLINSALVSAQSRQRLYWVGKREPDGTYSRVDVEQPEDLGILLRDILESGVCWREKGYALQSAATCDAEDAIKRRQRNAVAEPVNVTMDGKSQCLRATCYKDGIRNMVGNTVDRKTCVAEPIRVGDMPTKAGRITGSQNARVYSAGGKHPALTSRPNGGGKDGPLISEPVRIGTIESGTATKHDRKPFRVYSPDAKSVTLQGEAGGIGAKTGLYATPMRVPEATKQGYVDIYPCECVDLAMEHSKTRRGRRMVEKSNCLTTGCALHEYCGTLDKPIYQVKDGMITIKGKQYPIKLRDGCYIIRKLTVLECMRLQTVPEGYVFPVSDTQAYKMLGNGWTVDVIAHIIGHIPGIRTETVEVLSMYDGMSCGHIALDKLGATVARYYATEIDKYAIQTTQTNYQDTVQLGDAFQVREDGWTGPAPGKE